MFEVGKVFLLPAGSLCAWCCACGLPRGRREGSRCRFGRQAVTASPCGDNLAVTDGFDGLQVGAYWIIRRHAYRIPSHHEREVCAEPFGLRGFGCSASKPIGIDTSIKASYTHAQALSGVRSLPARSWFKRIGGRSPETSMRRRSLGLIVILALFMVGCAQYVRLSSAARNSGPRF
jgi:hypothetical protein